MRCSMHMGVQVHKRVRLAIRLDEVQRQQTKEKAEHTWRKRSADEVSSSCWCAQASVLPLAVTMLLVHAAGCLRTIEALEHSFCSELLYSCAALSCSPT